jgi:DNA-binding protein HU-beta
MTHKDLIAELANRLGWKQTKVSETLDTFVTVMNEKLSENYQLSVHNFGVFETKKKAERISVNPQTQERYLVPPKIVANFRPSANVKVETRGASSLQNLQS